MPAQNLLAKIHIAKKDLGLSDLEYRDLLSSVTKKESSKDMTDLEAQKVLNRFKTLGWSAKRGTNAKIDNRLRFEDFGIRPGFATPKQLRKIHATWMTSPRVQVKTDQALSHYIENIFNISNLRFIPSGMVGKILRAIEALIKEDK